MKTDFQPWAPSQWLLTKKCAIENMALLGIRNQYTMQPPSGYAVLEEISPSCFSESVKNEVDRIINKLQGK